MDECLPIKQDHVSFLRKSAYGRTNLFIQNCTFREIKCSASTVTRCASASIFHKHKTNDAKETPIACACWHCCHDFENEGFRVPRVYDPTEREYHVFGWFCSANCSKAYILEHSTFDRGYQMNIFVRMLRDVYGITDPVVEAPPRISLQKFGGPFTIDNFRSQKNICFIMSPPFISYSMLIEERQPIPSIGEANIPRGSVKGLRRPESGTTSLEESHMCNPPVTGLYSTFLNKTLENESSEIVKEEVSKTITKRQKTRPLIAKTGLAKFME